MNGVSSSHDRILRILEELEEFKSIKSDDQSLSIENKNLKSEITKLNSKVKEIDEIKQNLEVKYQDLELKINELQSEGTDKPGIDCSEFENGLQTCQSQLTIKLQEIDRLNKIIEQLQNQPTSSDNKKIPWKTILIPSVISLLVLIVLIVGFIVIIVKINFIIQKLKDQFQNTRRPLNVPNDFWHHED